MKTKYTIKISYKLAEPETGIGVREIDVENELNINYAILGHLRDLEMKNKIVTEIVVQVN